MKKGVSERSSLTPFCYVEINLWSFSSRARYESDDKSPTFYVQNENPVIPT